MNAPMQPDHHRPSVRTLTIWLLAFGLWISLAFVSASEPPPVETPLAVHSPEQPAQQTTAASSSMIPWSCGVLGKAPKAMQWGAAAVAQ